MSTERTLQLIHISITAYELENFYATSAYIIDCLISHVVTGQSERSHTLKIKIKELSMYQQSQTTGERCLEISVITFRK